MQGSFGSAETALRAVPAPLKMTDCTRFRFADPVQVVDFTQDG
jgi:hypothetical protein